MFFRWDFTDSVEMNSSSAISLFCRRCVNSSSISNSRLVMGSSRGWGPEGALLPSCAQGSLLRSLLSHGISLEEKTEFMTWHGNLEDFGEEIEPGTRLRVECRPGLNCFGTCCATDVSLTPYDIARMRRHLGIDTHRFLSAYCLSRVDSHTGFPCVLVKSKEDGTCIFLESHGCEIYESRPSCCRNYPLARVIEDEDQGSKRSTKYYLQRRATYCKGMGRGPEWTIEAYCEENGLGPYERANDLFLQIPFAFDTLPLGVRQDKEVQTMIYQAVFDFDRCLETSGRLGSYPPPDDDHEMIVLLTGITLNLIRKTANLNLKE